MAKDPCSSWKLDEKGFSAMAAFFQALGAPTRIHILFLLLEQGVCVNDLAKKLGMTQSAVSHQLSMLKADKLVQSKRVGRLIYYSLTDDHVRNVLTSEIVYRKKQG